MTARLAFVAARFAIATFSIVTALYCLLAYIPFTYHQIHLGGLLAWVSLFAEYHAYLCWVAWVLAGLTLPWNGGRALQVLSGLFLVVYGAAGVALLLRPLLVTLENNVQSLGWGLLALTPLLWMAAIDWLSQRGRFSSSRSQQVETFRLLRACLIAAIWAWMLSAYVVVVRHALTNNPHFELRKWMAALAWSLALHLLVFTAVFLLANFTRAIASLVSESLRVQVIFHVAVSVIALGLVLKFIVFLPLSFSGWLATVTALAFALSISAFFSGVAARVHGEDDGSAENALELLLIVPRWLPSWHPVIRGLVLLAFSALGVYLLMRATTTDWEFLLQKLIVIGIWMTAFAFFYSAAPSARKRGGDSLVFAAAVLPCLYMGYISLQPTIHPSGELASPDATGFLEEYRNYDVGFRLVQDMTSPPTATSTDDSLYGFLAENTNIPRSVRTDPVEINLTAQIVPKAGRKPDIFVIVIDSLRRDYVSPYNQQVTFTPGIDAFARESTVFANAFTRYTGTGLSEPSIWTGAMLLHKQYVTPFYPMNSLEKLLQAEEYRQFVAKDEILKTILPPSAPIGELQSSQSTMNLEACPALGELQSKISGVKDAGSSIFAYIQPQDLHVSAINRQNRSVLDGQDYPGFDAAYASRVEKVDKCFAEFIRFLKTSGLYESSIVVLTADHGDSLGEKGRWGHAYNVVPEVARVPLIVHVPEAIRPPFVDQTEPAFLTDITPTLYYLLGQRPIVQNPIFGKPLFTTSEAESAPYRRSSYLIASSYGPVYAVLGDQGHSLYVADAVDYKEYFYQWRDSSNGSAGTVTPGVRASGRVEIRSDVSAIDHFYGMDELAKR